MKALKRYCAECGKYLGKSKTIGRAVCADCVAERKPCHDCNRYFKPAKLAAQADGREVCPCCRARAQKQAAKKSQRSLFCETGSLFDSMDENGRAEALSLFA